VTSYLNPGELDALLRGADPACPEPARSEPRPEPYDFRSPGRLSKAGLNTLTSLYDRFGREFASSLSTTLRSLCEVTLVNLDAVSYADFASSLPDPTCFHTLELEPGGGRAVLELSPDFVFAAVDRLLGGSGAPFVPSRVLTPVEREVMATVTDLALEGLAAMWRPVSPEARFVITASETSPWLSQPLPPREQVVAANFQVLVGGSQGAMDFACAAHLIESLATPRAAAPSRSSQQTDGGDARLQRALMRARLPLSVELPQRPIRLGDLLELRPGDVLSLNSSAEGSVVVRLVDRPRMQGQAVTRSGLRAVRVESFLEEGIP
jgi:flagellar motor switch protein FliM